MTYNKNIYLAIIIYIFIISFLLIKINNPTKKQYFFSYQKNKQWQVVQKFSNKLILQKTDKKYLFYCKKLCSLYHKNDVLQFSGYIFPLNQPLSANDYNVSYAHPDVSANVSVKKNTEVKIIKTSKISIFAKIKDKIIRNVKEKSKSPLAISLLTGNKKELDKKIYKDFQEAGIAHILAISGLHIGGIALIFFLLFHKFFSLFKNLSEKYDNRKISLLLSLLVAYFFLFLADFPISGQRAFIFLMFFSLAYLFAVIPSLINITLLTSAVILLINPYNLFLVGFQLSFTAICAIIITMKYLPKMHNYNYAIKIFITSSIISIFVLPISLFYFSSGSIISPFANIFAIPLVTLIIMPLGIFSIIMDGFFSINLFYIFDICLNFLGDIASFFAQYNLDSIKILKPNKFSLFALLIILVSLICFKKDYKTIILSIILYGCSLFISSNDSDIILFEKNNFFLIKSDNNNYLISKKPKREFLRKKIKNLFGETKLINLQDSKIEEKNIKFNCQDKICFYEKENIKISFINKKITYIHLQDICKKVDLVIYNRVTFDNCFSTTTISRHNLRQFQKLKIFIKKGKIYYE